MVPEARGRAQKSPETPSGFYGRDDALLIYAALVEGPARRSLDARRILELAELIGRSPGSISLKAAGFRALEAGDSPRTRRVSWVQRAVRLDFDGKTKELLEEATRLRTGLLRRLASARIEWRVSESTFLERLGEIEELATSAGFPRTGWLLFSHSREEVRGVALSSSQIVADPESAARFARELRQRVGRVARTSAGFLRVERGAVAPFIRGILSWKFPTLHLKELPRDVLLRLGAEAARPIIHGLVVNQRDVENVLEEDLAAFRHNIRQVLGFSATPLCPTCLVLLGYLAGQVARKGSFQPT